MTGITFDIWSHRFIVANVTVVQPNYCSFVIIGKPTGSVWKETIAVSATMWISVEKVHHQIRLRILSCGRMSRGPEVPEERAPVVECHDGLARITLEDLAITHFVKSGTLQNACSTRPRVVVGLGKSAHSHIVRLMNNRRKGLKRLMTISKEFFVHAVSSMDSWPRRSSQNFHFCSQNSYFEFPARYFSSP